MTEPMIDMSGPLPKIVHCPRCVASWHAWLEYRPPPPPIRLDGTGIRTVRDVRDAAKRRADDAYALIRHQQELITRICAKRHHLTAELAGTPGGAADMWPVAIERAAPIGATEPGPLMAGMRSNQPCPITGTVITLRAAEDGLPDAWAVFTREDREATWWQVTGELDEVQAAHWRGHQAQRALIPARLSAFLTELADKDPVWTRT